MIYNSLAFTLIWTQILWSFYLVLNTWLWLILQFWLVYISISYLKLIIEPDDSGHSSKITVIYAMRNTDCTVCSVSQRYVVWFLLEKNNRWRDEVDIRWWNEATTLIIVYLYFDPALNLLRYTCIDHECLMAVMIDNIYKWRLILLANLERSYWFRSRSDHESITH